MKGSPADAPRVAPVYTVGAGDRSFGAIAADCGRYDAGMLVDLRATEVVPAEGDLAPPELEALAGEAGIGYRRITGSRLDDAGAVCDEILGLTATTFVALLCESLDPSHRDRAAALAPYLASRGLALLHIGADGIAEPHQDRLEL